MNQLQTIVNESGLSTPKATAILDQFKGYFELASEWEIKAKALTVIDASQEVEMKMARAARLFLREKRIAIEKTRKSLKEQSLREGKAIDGITNVLKALIVPIEEHLQAQEDFVEIKAQEAAAKERERINREVEKQRIANEKVERKDREELRLENARLQKLAAAREAKLEKERKRSKIKLDNERRAAAEEQEKTRIKQKKIDDATAAKQKIINDKNKVKLQRAKNAKAAADKKTADLRAKLKAMVECPKCYYKFIPKK